MWNSKLMLIWQPSHIDYQADHGILRSLRLKVYLHVRFQVAISHWASSFQRSTLFSVATVLYKHRVLWFLWRNQGFARANLFRATRGGQTQFFLSDFFSFFDFFHFLFFWSVEDRLFLFAAFRTANMSEPFPENWGELAEVSDFSINVHDGC